MKLRNLLTSTVTLLLPASCPVCWSSPLIYPDFICKKCKKNIRKEIDIVFRKTPTIHQSLACAKNSDHIKIALKLFKYNKKHIIFIFDPLIKQASEIRSDHFRNIDIIIPVPLHKKRQQQRGFNQSELIAERLAVFTKITVLTRSLTKIKNTISQTGISSCERKNNIKDTFSIIHPDKIKGKSVLLVDDIITTGATMETCAKEIMKAGARDIKGFTLGYTP